MPMMRRLPTGTHFLGTCRANTVEEVMFPDPVLASHHQFSWALLFLNDSLSLANTRASFLLLCTLVCDWHLSGLIFANANRNSLTLYVSILAVTARLLLVSVFGRLFYSWRRLCAYSTGTISLSFVAE